MRSSKYLFCLTIVCTAGFISCDNLAITHEHLKLNKLGYYEQRGLNILVFNNWYDGLFSDSKMSGIEVIHHGVRTVTNGDVRLDRTPEQWDEIPTFIKKEVDTLSQSISAYLSYPKYNFNYVIQTEILEDGILISVHLDKPLPQSLNGRAGLNIEFLPSAYFEKSYLIDGKPGTLPLYPSDEMEIINDKTTPKAIATGMKLIMAPENIERKITITSNTSLSLYDGRNKAQNGWFVVQSLIPSDKTGKVIEWKFVGATQSDWMRKPVIGHSQVGYHPDQPKIAVIELDENDKKLFGTILYKVQPNGDIDKVWTANTEYFGKYNRYHYATFDFSHVIQEGIYFINYNNIVTAPFKIAKDVYKKAWHPTLDVFLPVQMDHVLVNEAYRVWHGQSHMDDAMQAPINTEHFDLYAQGASTDSPYKPGEHIPGLNIGGWYDAGDYDIRTQTQYSTVLQLVHTWEEFRPTRDQTLIDQKTGYIDLHHPDGKIDILQQIEHGTLALLAQHKSVGHAIPGIIVPTIEQYTHLGDGLTMTDNLIYDPNETVKKSNGLKSTKLDDRWAFTSRSSALNYGSAAGLAAAGRVMNGYNDQLSKDCISTAMSVWNEEQSKSPDLFHVGNTTGGILEEEMLKAAVELLILSNDKKYIKAIIALWPKVEERFSFNIPYLLLAMPYMDAEFQQNIATAASKYAQEINKLEDEIPYGLPVTRGGWAGNGTIIQFGINNYLLNKSFPEVFDQKRTYRALNYLYGTHPDSDISFVSAVGTKSKKVAYGMNRADFSFIAGGIVPGVLVLPPDFPENKEDWPFLWGENEYVVNLSASYIYLVHSVDKLLNKE